MTNDDTKLAQTLVGLYKVVRLQQEAIYHLTTGWEALVSVLPPSEVQRFEEAHEKALTGKTGQALAGSLQLIDVTIASLERDYGPWDN